MVCTVVVSFSPNERQGLQLYVLPYFLFFIHQLLYHTPLYSIGRFYEFQNNNYFPIFKIDQITSIIVNTDIDCVKMR